MFRNITPQNVRPNHHIRSWFKGADTAAVVRFLEQYLGDHVASLSVRDPYLESALDACRGANRFLSTLYKHGVWLPYDACVAASNAGFMFLRGYMECAQFAYDQQKTRYKLQPKLHPMAHFVKDLSDAANRQQRYTWNILNDGTQMNEDFIGKVAAISRVVDSRRVHEATVERYLVNMWKHI